jgi:hypothetical protein
MDGSEVRASMPLRATVLKQNCGVRAGGGGGCVIMSFGVALGASVCEGFFQIKVASMKLIVKRLGCAPGAGLKVRGFDGY